MNNVIMTGLTGSYPNGGFPAQAFYGIQGTQVQSAGASSTPSSASNVNLFSTSSIYTTVATVMILLVGGYMLWHFTA